MWGRVLILAALTLAAAWPPAAAHAHVTLAQEIRVEIGVDRSERIHWSARATNTLVEGILLPPGASVANVTAYGTPLVSTQTTRADGRVLVEPARRTTQMDVEARLAPPSGELHPLYSRRWTVEPQAGAAAQTHIVIEVPPSFRLFHASPTMPEADGRSMESRATGQALVVYAYRAPLDLSIGLVEIDEGIYHVIGPARGEAQMRQVARLATEASALAAEQAGLALRSPYWVRFAPERVFGFEAGYYGFDGIIALRRGHLDNATASGSPWVSAEALVHETFHATSAPFGPGAFRDDVTWWFEGSARYAERFVSGDDGWRACEGSWCWTFQSQLRSDELEALYAADWEFDPSWSMETVAGDGARALHYEYSAFLVAAYVQRYGRDAYAAAWSDVLAASADPTCACDEAWLRQALIRHSGGRLSDDELYAPFRDLRVEDAGRFADLTEALVAHEPRPGAPVGWTLPPRPNATAPPPEPTGYSPSFAWDGEAPRRVSWATLIGLRVHDMDVNETRTSEAPHARLRWRLDGAQVQPRLSVRDDHVSATFVGVQGGTHVVEVEARRPGGGVFHPLLSANLTFDLPPAYALEIVEPTGDILAPGARVAGRLVDALDGAPFVGIGVILEAEGIPIRLNVTDADGRVTFDLPEGVAERLVLGLAVEGARDAPGARVERILRTQPPAPLDTSAIPAASLEPERGTPGEPLAALLVVALVSALAARRRGAA